MRQFWRELEAASRGGGGTGVAAATASVSEASTLHREVAALPSLIRNVRDYTSGDEELLPESEGEKEKI